MATIMDGAKLAEEIRHRVRSSVEELRRYGVETGLALLQVGDNPASRQYFNAARQAGKKAGISVHEYLLPATASVNSVLAAISAINRDETINGLLVLLPLPQRLNARRVVNAINPEKDIDGLGAISVGRLTADESTFQLIRDLRPGTTNHTLPLISGFLPCTPFGVMRLLEHYHIGLRGKHAVIIGKSFAVGKPLSLMMLAMEATVTVCHRETENLAQFTRQADILCSATGKTGLITADMVKPGAVVVDIGITVLADGTIVGDVDYGPVSRKASYITPVPGGVGPVTIAMLLENTLLSAQRRERSNSPFMLV